MSESIRVTVVEQSQTGEARRMARSLAERAGFDETWTEQVALVVTEVCTNLIKHAGGGEVLLQTANDNGPVMLVDFEVLALDRGPGMSNLEQCLRDGYSTGGSPGQGLGAITRLATTADFYSRQGGGTAVLARWSPKPPRPSILPSPWLHIGAVNVCKPGQDVCGDSWGVEQTEDVCHVLVADGLGHGPEARTASAEAVRILRAHPKAGAAALIELVHGALRSSRGAAVAVATIDNTRRQVTFAGVGNIAAQIYSGAKPCQHLVSVNGTAGHQVPRIREFHYDWPADGMLLLHSDGLTTSTGIETLPGLSLRDPSLIAGVLYRDFTRRNDDATAVVVKMA